MKKLIFIFLIMSSVYAVSQEIKPYSELNTERDDYAITFRSTCDGMEMWLTNFREGSNKRSRRIVMSAVDKQGMQSLVEMPYPINQKKDRGESDVYLDGSPCFNACNPNYGVFTSNRLYNGKTYENDLYEMTKDGDNWVVRRIDEVNSNAWDDTPSLSPDGRFLYFSSDRKRAGYGETDLYMSQRLSDGWSAPVPLDEICELHKREQTPLAAADGYLYYATDRSGDFDIWRVKLNEVTGKPIAGTQEEVPFKGVNQKGSSEGHPSFSPGLNWFIFSSDMNSKDRSYDLFYKKINDGSDTLYLKALLRTMKFNKDFEEYEDAIEPYKTKLIAKDLFTDKTYNGFTDSQGNLALVVPRAIGRHPAQDRRIREIEIKAETESFLHISATDTLIFELGYNCKLTHSLYIWDVKVLEISECKQNFPITDVEFFITGYWCPTTKRFSSFTSCQSVFPEEGCFDVPKIDQPCPDNDLYNYKVNQPSVERYRNPGLCANLSEVEKHGEEWSVKVDDAIVKFVDNVRSALKKPCILRAIRQNKKVTIEVIGWTDPRQIDNACLYTGKDIDFNSSAIKLYNYESKPYLRNGILKRNTKFRESGSGGNELLSEVRAYYTAELLDNLWTVSLPEYAELRRDGKIEVVAVGKSVKPDQIDMARQRSVNVRIMADADAEQVKSKSTPELGSSIALCGNECLKNLLCRNLEMTSKINIEEVISNPDNGLEKKLNEVIKPIEDEKTIEPIKPFETPKEIKEEPKPEIKKIIEKAPQEVKKETKPEQKTNEIIKRKTLACYCIRFVSVNSESEAKEILAGLRGIYNKELKLSVFTANNGSIFYRIVTDCFDTVNDASSELRAAKQAASELGLEQVPIIIKE